MVRIRGARAARTVLLLMLLLMLIFPVSTLMSARAVEDVVAAVLIDVPSIVVLVWLIVMAVRSGVEVEEEQLRIRPLAGFRSMLVPRQAVKRVDVVNGAAGLLPIANPVLVCVADQLPEKLRRRAIHGRIDLMPLLAWGLSSRRTDRAALRAGRELADALGCELRVLL